MILHRYIRNIIIVFHNRIYWNWSFFVQCNLCELNICGHFYNIPPETFHSNKNHFSATLATKSSFFSASEVHWLLPGWTKNRCVLWRKKLTRQTRATKECHRHIQLISCFSTSIQNRDWYRLNRNFWNILEQKQNTFKTQNIIWNGNYICIWSKLYTETLAMSFDLEKIVYSF